MPLPVNEATRASRKSHHSRGRHRTTTAELEDIRRFKAENRDLKKANDMTDSKGQRAEVCALL